MKYDESIHIAANFFGSYLNQDWDLDFKNPLEVVNAYVRESHKQDVDKLKEALDCILQVNGDITEDFFYEKLGAYYTPSADGLTVRTFIECVLERLMQLLPPSQPK